jgi:prolyl oligopeptidase
MRNPPDTRRDDIDGDPYRWLEQTGDDVQEWMNAHDDRAREYLGALPGRAKLAERLRALFYYDAISPPVLRGDRMFYTRKHSDREKTIVYWRPRGGDESEERVLFDPNEMSDDGTVSLGVWTPNRDGSLVAYALRENNADEATLHLRDVDSGEDRAIDVISGAKYANPSWTPDGAAFYYTWLPVDDSIDAADLPGHAEIRLHVIGADPATDRVIYPATGDSKTFVHGEISHEGDMVVVHVMHGWNSIDIYAGPPDGELATIVEGKPFTYEATPHAGSLYLLTNDEAPLYRVVRVADGEWTTVVPEGDAKIASAHIHGGHLILDYLRDAHSELEVRSLDGTDARPIELPFLGTVGSVVGQPDQPDLYFSHSSFTQPTHIYRCGISSATTELWARVDIGVDTSTIVSEQVRYVSKDGTEITAFILRRSDVDNSRPRPTVLYGYGGFNHSLTPAFNPSLVPWLEDGGVFVVTNLRGGGEYGEQWHRDGMLANKQNVFDDFIAAADYLIAEGWATTETLAIRGGSNGGLLVGAAMTQRPDLFRAVICAVPLLDMLRFHKFGSGITWVPEYGDPEDPEQHAVLASYSPYHHVESAAYPAMLMLSADSDDRVDPMHARKFVAIVQHATTSAAPIILRIERNAGHGGADMVAQQVEQAADQWAFLTSVLGGRGRQVDKSSGSD